jgi:hypothetical protein
MKKLPLHNRAIPVLIIAYAREDRVLDLLKKMELWGRQKVFISIDGPRSAEIAEIQIRMRQRIQSFASNSSLEILVLDRKENLGIRSGVISGIDWFFSKVDAGIILEDDLSPSYSFFEFADRSIPIISSQNDVWLSSGNNFLQPSNEPHEHYANYPLIWGWATTREKWIAMREAIFYSPKLSLKQSLNSVSNYWYLGAVRTKFGKIDTWDISLAFAMRDLGKFCMIPPVNLVSNIGNDEYASHTSSDDFPLNLPTKEIDFAQFRFAMNFGNVAEVNSRLERELFNISRKHQFSFFYAKFLKFFYSK